MKSMAAKVPAWPEAKSSPSTKVGAAKAVPAAACAAAAAAAPARADRGAGTSVGRPSSRKGKPFVKASCIGMATCSPGAA